jgi:hypothetical protein
MKRGCCFCPLFFCPYFCSLAFARAKESKQMQVAEVRTTVLWQNQKVEALRNELFQWPIFYY